MVMCMRLVLCCRRNAHCVVVTLPDGQEISTESKRGGNIQTVRHHVGLSVDRLDQAIRSSCGLS